MLCLLLPLLMSSIALGFSSSANAFPTSPTRTGTTLLGSSSSDTTADTPTRISPQDLFDTFVQFLQDQQTRIIDEIHTTIESSSEQRFGTDRWGGDDLATTSGGITRVLQNGDAISKGACSLTVLRQGTLTAERAATIRSRQRPRDSSDDAVMVPAAGDTYSAAALSMVLHSRNPFVPTFRSDVRIFLVETAKQQIAWFGGGADLTPYYLDRDDISNFHGLYRDVCRTAHCNNTNTNNDDDDDSYYRQLKQECDAYFFLPARNEHRGTGGIFFDDQVATPASLAFVQRVAETWMPSWIPIVQKHNHKDYTPEQQHWQRLRRGRYLEFNLLYDRGVKFGLQTANPRVEGVMVSAPPEIAYEYQHEVVPGSPEAELVEILQNPIDWV